MTILTNTPINKVDEREVIDGKKSHVPSFATLLNMQEPENSNSQKDIKFQEKNEEV